MSVELLHAEDFLVSGKGDFNLDCFATTAGVDESESKAYKKALDRNVSRIAKFQERLYASGEEGVIIMLQAMDAAGKDSTIEHVFSGVNPAGVSHVNFKTPSKEELAHDYLWRVNNGLPRRGEIGIFNRSHYEDVLITRVLGLWKGYNWPKRCRDIDEQEFFNKRYKQINNYEEYLYENGYRIVKIFLNLGKDEQKARFMRRIELSEKNWKFSAGDVDTRQSWDEYMLAYEDTIKNTAKEHAPWYVIPADQKFVARYLVSEVVLGVLEGIDPKFPDVSDEDKAVLIECKARLESE